MDKVVEKSKSGLKLSNNYMEPPQIHHHKIQRIWHHKKPEQRGQTTKTHRLSKKGINQRGNKNTKLELESSTVQAIVFIGPLYLQDPYKLDFTKKWPEKSLQLQMKIRMRVQSLPKGMWEIPQIYGRQTFCSNETKTELFVHQVKCYVQRKNNMPHLPKNTVEHVFHQQRPGN